MNNVALIHPAIDFEENYPCSWIPYSVLSLASRMNPDKYTVKIYDEHKVPFDKIMQSLVAFSPYLVGISIMTGGGQIERALLFAQQIKMKLPNTVIVFGGPHVNVLPEQTLENELIDFVSAGTGQDSFVQLADCLLNQKEPSGIDGIYYKDSNSIVCRPKNLKAIIPHLYPYNFSLIEPEDYIRYDATISDRTINYIASQGCPYACNFCYECTYQKKYYTMSTQCVRNDIELLATKYNATGIKFYDADFFINYKRCREIIQSLNDYNLSWAASIHPNDILHNRENGTNLLEEIRNSNCKRLLMGMESGSDRVLKEIVNKHVTSNQLVEVAKMIGEFGILGAYTFMVGYPDETEDEQNATLELVEKLWTLNLPIETKVHIYLPYPGTPLYKRAIELGFVPPDKLEDWSCFNYYKAMTPWTDIALEQKIANFTKMIDKNK